jgi:hypothetical protein
MCFGDVLLVGGNQGEKNIYEEAEKKTRKII